MTSSYRKKIDLGCINFGDHSISSTDKVKFKGICIDNHLTSKDHANQISSEMSKTVRIFYKLSEFFPPKDFQFYVWQLCTTSFYARCEDLFWSTRLHPRAHRYITEEDNSFQKLFTIQYSHRSIFQVNESFKVKNIQYFSMSTRAFKFIEK